MIKFDILESIEWIELEERLEDTDGVLELGCRREAWV